MTAARMTVTAQICTWSQNAYGARCSEPNAKTTAIGGQCNAHACKCLPLASQKACATATALICTLSQNGYGAKHSHPNAKTTFCFRPHDSTQAIARLVAWAWVVEHEALPSHVKRDACATLTRRGWKLSWIPLIADGAMREKFYDDYIGDDAGMSRCRIHELGIG